MKDLELFPNVRFAFCSWFLELLAQNVYNSGCDDNQEVSDGASYLFCHPQPSNQMNSSLTSLYLKGQPDSGTCSPRRDQLAVSSPSSAASLAPTAGTVVSTGGWFIDRGRRHEKSNILIDLCEDEPTKTETNVRMYLWRTCVCDE